MSDVRMSSSGNSVFCDEAVYLVSLNGDWFEVSMAAYLKVARACSVPDRWAYLTAWVELHGTLIDEALAEFWNEYNSKEAQHVLR